MPNLQMLSSTLRTAPPMVQSSGVSDLKQRVSTQFASWDADGDGVLEAEDFIKNFDTSGDGMLDESELAPLVKQLSDQIDFNNALLEEMASLEQNQLDTQVSMKEKAVSLRQSLEVAEAARTEASEWRRKFAICQEVAETNAGKLTETRVELGTQRREFDAATARAVEMKKQVEESARVVASLERSLEKTAGQLKNGSTVSRDYKEEMEGKFAALGNTNAALAAQTDKFRKKVNSLESELTKLRDSYKEAVREVELEQGRTQNISIAKDEVLVRETNLENEVSRLKQANRKFEGEARENNSRAENAAAALTAAQSDLAATKEELSERDERVAMLKRTMGEATRENGKLKRSLDENVSMLENAMKVRAETNLHHESKLAEVQEKNAKLLEEMRIMGQEHALELQKRGADLNEMKTEYEGRLTGNEKEMAGLHELLSKGNVGTQELLDGFARERDEYEASIRGLNTALAEKEVDLINVKEEKEKAQTMHSGQAKVLKREQQSLVKSFVDAIEELQKDVKSVTEKHVRQKEEMGEMTSQFVTLATFVRSLENKNAEPIDGWFKEVVKGFELLIEQNSAVKANLEEMKDDAKKSSLGKLDEQSKTLLLEEEVSRLEFDIGSVEQERDAREAEMKGMHQVHVSQLKEGKDEVKKVKELLDGYKSKLDKSEARCAALQKKSGMIGETLADAHKRGGEKSKQMEERVADLEGQLKKLQREQQALLEQRNELQRETEEQERAVRLGKTDMDNGEKRWLGVVDDLKKKGERAAQNLSDSNKTNQQLQKQCEQTKKLLLTIQQQRANLKDENYQLKGELDEIYKRAGK